MRPGVSGIAQKERLKELIAQNESPVDQKVQFVDRDGKGREGKIVAEGEGTYKVQPVGFFGKAKGEPMEVPRQYVVERSEWNAAMEGPSAAEKSPAYAAITQAQEEVASGNSAWDESEHPRGEGGQFTEKQLQKAAQLAKEMPQQLLDGLCSEMSGEEHPWQACMDRDFGEFEPEDKEAFCAWLKRECGLEEDK